MWGKLLHVPRPYLYAGIAVLSMLGVYAIGSSVLNLWLVLAWIFHGKSVDRAADMSATGSLVTA
ncbi:hypothetical protein B841_09515 [Corynebacterium maris DSM 45190]|uniref:Uncharacterized protein n=2 Tax=Corynebacterium TaxID=1716 RepID=S5TKF9_9CORY|nr:hypothetical protein B841_09515 [Corynebacterium maris DSM 45190]